MNKTNKRLKAHFGKLLPEGCTLSVPEITGSTHFKWRITGPDGTTRCIITAATPSDGRSAKNRDCRFKRMCRELIE